jgi:hypothetical protein
MLSKYLSAVPGYFRENGDNELRWDVRSSSLWFALLTVQDGRIKHYGFTSSKEQRRKLIEALSDPASKGAQLIGVWTGNNRTDLFLLSIERALGELPKVL